MQVIQRLLWLPSFLLWFHVCLLSTTPGKRRRRKKKTWKAFNSEHDSLCSVLRGLSQNIQRALNRRFSFWNQLPLLGIVSVSQPGTTPVRANPATKATRSPVVVEVESRFIKELSHWLRPTIPRWRICSCDKPWSSVTQEQQKKRRKNKRYLFLFRRHY